MKQKELPRTQSVTLNFIMNVILKISAFVFPLITFPYVSRVLGATGNGKIAFAVSVISYFSMVAQLGIPTYGIKACAACREDRIKLNKTVQELLIINSIMVVLVYLVFVIVIIFVPRFQNDRLLLAITSTMILLNAVGMDWLFQALEQYSYITIRNIVFKVLSIVLMLVFVHDPDDYIIYGGISVLGTCGSNILNILYAGRFLEHKPMKGLQIRQHFQPIISFFMLSVAVSIYTSMDTVMLGFMCGDTEVGYYAAATKLKSILVSSVTALGGVLLPRMSHYIATKRLEQFYKTIKKSFEFIIIVTFAISIYFFVMADSTIILLAGNGYVNAIAPMRIITITVILIGISNITGMQILVPTNREKYTTLSTAVGAVVNLCVNAIAIPKFGAAGAAVGTVVAEAVVLLVQFKYLGRELYNMLKGIKVLKILIGNGIATIALVILKLNMQIEYTFLQLFITAVVFGGIYGLVLVILREELVMECINKYVKKILPKMKC